MGLMRIQSNYPGDLPRTDRVCVVTAACTQRETQHRHTQIVLKLAKSHSKPASCLQQRAHRRVSRLMQGCTVYGTWGAHPESDVVSLTGASPPHHTSVPCICICILDGVSELYHPPGCNRVAVATPHPVSYLFTPAVACGVALSATLSRPTPDTGDRVVCESELGEGGQP